MQYLYGRSWCIQCIGECIVDPPTILSYCNFKYVCVIFFRVSMMGTQGQTNHKTLKMKGRQTCQTIRLASSHQELLQVITHFVIFIYTIEISQVSPKEIIHPDTFSVQEVHLLLRPNITGVVTCMISAIGMWLVIGTKLISYVNRTQILLTTPYWRRGW